VENIMRHVLGFTIIAACLCGSPARADFISGSYSSLTVGTTIDLTARGTLDWAKFGTDNENNTTNFFVATKIGNPVINPNITVLGSAPSGTPTLIQFANPTAGAGNVNFTWTNGNFGMDYPGPDVSSVNAVVTETIVPAVNSYPLGLGAEFTAAAGSDTRILDVYVQGFNSTMTISASLSGGASTSTSVDSTVLLPTDNNYYSFGVYEITYSGAGETLTVSVQTTSQTSTEASAPQGAFPNAGIFAAAAREGPLASTAPEPPSLVLLATGALGLLGHGWRRLKAAARS
jgi:hypothetical protein